MGALQIKALNNTWDAPVDIRDHREVVSFDDIELPLLSSGH